MKKNDNNLATIDWQKAKKMKPVILKDFHDQKDLFKTLFDLMPYEDKEDENDFYRINWTQAHVFVIDKFLPFMAMHGYTLQRSRKKVLFFDINKTIKEFKDKIAEQFNRMLKENNDYERTIKNKT